MKNLSDIKKILGISEEDTQKDELLSICSNMAEEFILCYCRLTQLPGSLVQIQNQIAAQMMKNGIGEEQNTDVSEIREGDMTVSFEKKERSTQYLTPYKTVLDYYRKLGY